MSSEATKVQMSAEMAFNIHRNDPEYIQGEQDWADYLNSRPGEDEKGRIHDPVTGKFMNEEAVNNFYDSRRQELDLESLDASNYKNYDLNDLSEKLNFIEEKIASLPDSIYIDGFNNTKLLASQIKADTNAEAYEIRQALQAKLSEYSDANLMRLKAQIQVNTLNSASKKVILSNIEKVFESKLKDKLGKDDSDHDEQRLNNQRSRLNKIYEAELAKLYSPSTVINEEDLDSSNQNTDPSDRIFCDPAVEPSNDSADVEVVDINDEDIELPMETVINEPLSPDHVNDGWEIDDYDEDDDPEDGPTPAEEDVSSPSFVRRALNRFRNSSYLVGVYYNKLAQTRNRNKLLGGAVLAAAGIIAYKLGVDILGNPEHSSHLANHASNNLNILSSNNLNPWDNKALMAGHLKGGHSFLPQVNSRHIVAHVTNGQSFTPEVNGHKVLGAPKSNPSLNQFNKSPMTQVGPQHTFNPEINGHKVPAHSSVIGSSFNLKPSGHVNMNGSPKITSYNLTSNTALVHSGDNPWTISETALHIPLRGHLTSHQLHAIWNYDHVLMHLNHIKDPHDLQVGTLLKKPSTKVSVTRI